MKEETNEGKNERSEERKETFCWYKLLRTKGYGSAAVTLENTELVWMSVVRQRDLWSMHVAHALDTGGDI